MSLASVGFAFFLPIVFAIYWLGPKRAGWQNSVLLLANLVFYATWSLELFGLVLASTTLNWALARVMDGRVGRARRALLAAAITADVSVLVVFKYLGFLVDSFNAMMGRVGLDAAVPLVYLILPLGISYTTIIRIGYILDVYHERQPAEASWLRHTVFVTNFAHIMAGPVVRAGAMLTQYASPRRLNPADLSAGATGFLLGYTLNAYVASYIGTWYVDPVFSAHSEYSVVAHWIGLIGYAIQIFADFAGYSLMAIGVGRVFGLALPENFRTPYLSTGMLEFWRRWHISLNAWLFDYLFVPWTTGKSWMRGRIGLGFMAVFLVSGLWHGAAWTFVLWGFLHGVALVVQHRWDLFYKGLCRKDRAWVQRRKRLWYTLAGWAITQAFFLLTLLPFRSPSIGFTFDYLQRMFVAEGTLTPNLLSLNFAFCLAILVAWHLADLPQGAWLRPTFARMPAPMRGIAWGVLVVFLGLFVPLGAGAFIYANF